MHLMPYEYPLKALWFSSFPSSSTLLSVCTSLSGSQTYCAQLSSSWIMVISGPGSSGSVLGRRKASPARKDSPCTGQPRGTAPSLEGGQEPLQSVTTMVRMENTTNLADNKNKTKQQFFIYFFTSYYIISAWYIFSSVAPAADDCDDPRIPPGAQRSAGRFYRGEKVTYWCQAGLDLLGSAERVCMSNREWSGSTPRCQGAE